MNLKTVTSVATMVIAAGVASISLGQWLISRKKLRLDLFARRFDIYLRVLDHYFALVDSQNSNMQLPTLIPFVKAVRESRFMFPKKSDVHRFLEEFQTRANEIASFRSNLMALEEAPEKRRELSNRQSENLAWIHGEALLTLESKMEPYVKFR